MKGSFAGQPFEDGQDLRDFLLRVLQDPTVRRLRIAVAWAKRSGLDRVANEIAAFSAHGGSSSVVIGIDEGGATKQGLALAIELFEEVFVFHDESGRTFHPKIYLAEADETAWALVGSNNLTAGGLYFNYEAAIECEIDLTSPDPTESELYKGVSAYLDRLLDDAPCIRLDETTLQVLLADPRYRIGDEDALRADRSQNDSDAPEDSDAASHGTTERDDGAPTASLFGRSAHTKRSPVPRQHRGTASAQVRPTSAPGGSAIPPTSPPVGTQPVATSAPAAGVPATVVKRWFKKMTASDAQQKRSPNTQITGNLKLNKAGLPIDHKAYFRHDFFGHVSWQATNRPRGVQETASVSFDVIDGASALGAKVLKVDHAEYRIADQNNVPTWLHWGDDLNSYLRSNSHCNYSPLVARSVSIHH